MTARVLSLTLGLSALPCHVATQNNRPIVGVLTQPLGVELWSDDHGLGATHDDRSYIAASYVKFAESAGARVVPLHFDSSNEELQSLFHQINGIIFPGGGTNFAKTPGNRFREAGDFLYNLALNSTDAGNPFPIHGTCQGFQMLHVMAAKTDEVLCGGCYDTEGTPLPLVFPSMATARDSKLFGKMDATLFSALMHQNLTENSHSSGVDPKAYASNKDLNNFFTILSTNVAPNGREFVSTVEAKRYPITASQWHPEKNNFEWGKIGALGEEAIPHSEEAVLLSQYMATNFVNRARKNSNRFSSSEREKEALIYNIAPVADPQGYFEQIYLWGQKKDNSPVLV